MCVSSDRESDCKLNVYGASGLDPTWEVIHTFPVADENAAKCCSASFYMGEGDAMQQIGDTQTYLVSCWLRVGLFYRACNYHCWAFDQSETNCK